MKIALYKKPSKGFIKKLVHYGICIVTLSRYSHCELIINEKCYSSSGRDNGVREKIITDIATSGHWDIFEINNANEEYALQVFNNFVGQKYDYLGVARYLFPFLPNIKNRWYCSELNAAMLNIPKEKTPQDLFKVVVLDRYTL